MPKRVNVYFIETYRDYAFGPGYRVHKGGYEQDYLHPSLVSLVRVVATSKKHAIARAIESAAGVNKAASTVKVLIGVIDDTR